MGLHVLRSIVAAGVNTYGKLVVVVCYTSLLVGDLNSI